ncbi:MAG: hypothetical protein AAB385_00695 [Planctomycetota bacterium]
MSDGKLPAASLLIPLVWFALVTLCGFTSDADENLSFSTGLYTDEGWRTHLARNLYLFGQPRIHELERGQWYWESPLCTALFYASYSAFGYGLAVSRAVSTIFTLLTGILIGSCAARMWGARFGVLGLLLFFLNYLTFGYARLAFIEPTMCFFIVLGLWLHVSIRRPFAGACLSGLSLGLALLAKPTALLALAGIALARLLDIRGSDNRRRSTLAWLAFTIAAAAPLATWLLATSGLGMSDCLMGDPGRAAPSLIPTDLRQLVINLLTLSATDVFNKNPLLPLLAGTYFILHGPPWGKNASPEQKAVSCGLLLTLLPFFAFTYRPPRFFLVVLPFLFLAAVGGVHALTAVPHRGGAACRPYRAFAWIVAAVTGYTLVSSLFHAAGGEMTRWSLVVLSGPSLLLAGVLLAWVRRALSHPDATRALLAPIPLLSISLAFFAPYYVGWLARKTDSVGEAGRLVRPHVHSGDVLVGQGATSVGFELDCRIVLVHVPEPHAYDWMELVRRTGATRLMLGEDVANEVLARDSGRLRPLVRFPLRHGRFVLFEVR